MSRTRYKAISRLLIMLMLMNPLTGMAMQWPAHSPDTNHCDDMQMMQHDHGSMVQKLCNMGTDCEELCNSAQHCFNNTSASLLSGYSSRIVPETDRSIFSSAQPFPLSLLQYELFRPPRA